MEIGENKIDTIFKYQIQIKIDGQPFYSDFDCKDEAEKFMSFLSYNTNCHWISIPVQEIITEEFKK